MYELACVEPSVELWVPSSMVLVMSYHYGCIFSSICNTCVYICSDTMHVHVGDSQCGPRSITAMSFITKKDSQSLSGHIRFASQDYRVWSTECNGTRAGCVACLD